MQTLFDDTPGNRVLKIVDDVGMELVVKEKSATGKTDALNLFFSSSVGCKQGCQYCWLSHSQSKFSFGYENSNSLLLDFALDFMEGRGWLNPLKWKVSFMGAGDPLSCPSLTRHRIREVYLDAQDRQTKITRFSFSTILPVHSSTMTEDYIEFFNTIDAADAIAPTRLYVSVGSFDQRVRRKLFPNAYPLDVLHQLVPTSNVGLRFHWTVTEQLKIDDELTCLVKLVDQGGLFHQDHNIIRLIPYNPIQGSKFTPYKYLKGLAERVNEIDSSLTCEILCSSGTSIGSACGMFEGTK
jgi:adenine C2-methylase RlmN of 23S rRNA A2503 and tRNA A37